MMTDLISHLVSPYLVEHEASLTPDQRQWLAELRVSMAQQLNAKPILGTEIVQGVTCLVLNDMSHLSLRVDLDEPIEVTPSMGSILGSADVREPHSSTLDNLDLSLEALNSIKPK